MADCGADLLNDSVSHGASISNLNSLPVNFPTAHEFIALSNARRQPVLSQASTARGAFNGTESLTLDGFSVGIMSSEKSNKNFNSNNNIYSEVKPSNNFNSMGGSEWSRVAVHQFSSSSSPAGALSSGCCTVSNNSSNPSLFSSSCPNSMSVFTPSASISPSAPMVLPAVTGSSSSSPMDYMVTNQKYLLVHSNPQHLHLQQQTTQAANSNGNYLQHPPSTYTGLTSNEYQGGTPSNHSTYSSFNIASPSASSGAHLTIPHMNSTPAAATGVAWTNNTINCANTMHMQSADATAPARYDYSVSRVQKHSQDIQRPRQTKFHHLHITTSPEPSITPMYPQQGYSNLYSTSPSMAPTSNSVQSSAICDPAQQYQWGVAPSPVDPNFNSGSSTPFTSPSPSLSHSHSDLSGVTCSISRSTSPIFESSSSSSSSSLPIRSRKSSTSSTSSSVSQRRMSTLRELAMVPSSPSPPLTPNHQCPKCEQYFAGPAVLLRHIESIHEKLLWNCAGCKSNLSRRDAVTRHINLSPMDSICRQVGTIGQIKMINGTEIHYEVSSYRAKPLDEVMNRMGKKTPVLKKEVEEVKIHSAGEGISISTPADYNGFGFEGEGGSERMNDSESEYSQASMELEHQSEEYDDGERQQKKRRRSLQSTLSRRKK
ncbi:hypothetical protein BGZ65_000760 [Modicella reniformis]|uniref:C2H2-type domain-containing protein n=1 Tax=Modicella reniformis TaxID=1440133 RepID=A0A9P6IM71_9FUNG|nr:hypothetical protein BGZ65_000760 [Modicella reniformis]